MADVQRTVDIFGRLKFNQLDPDWVKDVWENDFTDLPPMAINTEDEILGSGHFTSELAQVVKVLEPWARGDEGASGEGFWTVLVENEMPHKSLIALLYHVIETGLKRVSNATQKESAIQAAHVYVTLITVPGSGAFKVFHPMLFQKAADVLKICTQLDGPKRKRKASPAASQGNRKSKSRKKNHDVSEEAMFDESDEEDGVLTGQEVNKIRQQLIVYLKGFVHMLEVYNLRVAESSAHHAVQVLTELSRHETETASADFETDRQLNRTTSIPQLAYMGLFCLCSGSHGDTGAMTTTVFKYLFPNILMLVGDNKATLQTIPRSIQHTKDVAVAFVCHVLAKLGDVVVPSTRILLQHMCVKCPDKAEYRLKVAQAVIDVMKKLTNTTYCKMMEWIYKYSRNAKIGYRVFALDIISLLIGEPERKVNENEVDDSTAVLTHRYLLQMILSRCSDIAPTVRARAIVALANCTSSPQPVIINAIREIVTPKTLGRQPVTRLVPTPKADKSKSVVNTPSSETEKDEESSHQPTPDGADATPNSEDLVTIQMTPGVEVTLPDAQGVVSMIRRRAADEKVNVRKAALQAIENMIRLSGVDFNAKDLEVLHERCRDPALSVRKQAQLSLTSLLHEMPLNKEIQSAWLDGVLPMVLDRETSAMDKCLEMLETVLLDNICPAHRSNDESHQMAWSMLDILASNHGVELRRFLQKTFQLWDRQGKLKPNLVTSLQTHVNTPNNAAAWLVLAEVSASVSKFNAGFVLDYWRNNGKSADYDTLNRVLKVFGNIAKHLSIEDGKSLILDLQGILGQFNQPPELVSATVSTVSKLCKAQAGDQTSSSKMMSEWCEDLMKKCDLYLSKVILEVNTDDPFDEDLIARHLFTLGEIAQRCPDRTPKRVFMLVQSLIATPCITTVDGSTQQSSQSSQASEAPLSQIRASNMTSKIRAFAYITLGKLCLQNEDLAKKWIAAMAREMETSSDIAIRNNVVIIMCDLCVRYTALVDSYVPNIASCLKDKSPLIRKQTLILLTHLLQEDYVKWKGSLFYRFITTVVDEHKEIKELAEFCLVHLLLQRKPGMFSHHFVECIFNFNSYENHQMFNKFSQTDRDKELFSMKGKANASKRMLIYLFMLENMTDEQKFQLTAKLCQEVLDAIVNGTLPLDADSNGLLQDSLAILCCKEIKLSSLKTRPTDDVVEEQDMAAAVIEKAKKTLISQVLKKNVIENIVPIVIGLKHQLEKHRSPILKDLMMYLRELMKDYKNEVKDIMSGDPQLANEIEFDLRKFEEQQAEKELQKSAPPSRVNTPGRMSPANRSPMQTPNIGSPMRSPALRVPTPGKTPATSVAPASKTPGSPAQPRSDKPVTPAMTLLDKAARSTPGRPISMSTLAVINSARKAMENVRQIQDTERSVQRRRSLHKSSTDDEQSTTETISKDTFKTPKKKVGALRAISTPEGAVGNITFMQDGEHNLSMVPPSPIPTAMPLRVYSNNTDVRVPATPKSKNKDRELPSDMICMFSPDKPTPKPRVWNVKTPAPKIPDTTPIDVLTLDSGENSNNENTGRNTRPKRATRSRKR